MQTFPMFLQVGGRTVLILGGGEQAAQKCRLLLKTSARITVQAPEIEEELQGLVAQGRIAHDPAPPTAAACGRAAITFIGTGWSSTATATACPRSPPPGAPIRSCCSGTAARCASRRRPARLWP
ncbi:precorrin-2 dehydrogenase/sirohydrochlorin ferrochelatase family protein [Mangrovicoccus ximenensis]|uniref:precorrin-2 dehydrogenase/sirohydrochlorin ferrochelatase family protein n=1 Tax=Mangrovicoccus ximenensis TaxID=1911570 RepID=UPI002ED6257B